MDYRGASPISDARPQEARRTWILAGKYIWISRVYASHIYSDDVVINPQSLLTQPQQFVTPPPLNEAMKAQMGRMRPTWDFADFDFFIEYLVPDLGAITNVVSDPDWQVAIADQEKWVDTSKALVSVGYSIPYLLETGEVVNVPQKS